MLLKLNIVISHVLYDVHSCQAMLSFEFTWEKWETEEGASEKDGLCLVL